MGLMLKLHISQERFDSIKAGSYGTITVTPSAGAGRTIPVAFVGGNLVHILDGERAFCEPCGAEFDSIKADTPAEWAEAKARLQAQEKVELRSLEAIKEQQRTNIAAARALNLSGVVVGIDELERLLDAVEPAKNPTTERDEHMAVVLREHAGYPPPDGTCFPKCPVFCYPNCGCSRVGKCMKPYMPVKV